MAAIYLLFSLNRKCVIIQVKSLKIANASHAARRAECNDTLFVQIGADLMTQWAFIRIFHLKPHPAIDVSKW